MARIAVIGAGAWGTALAIQASRAGHDTVLWAFEDGLVDTINGRHVNDLYLPGERLPRSLAATADLAAACSGATLVVFACPSKFMREISSRASPHVAPDATVCVVSKGIEAGTLALMTEVLRETLSHLPPDAIAVLSGPSFAKEVARSLPTDVVVASPGCQAAREVQRLLHRGVFRVYTSDDVVGVQLGGALKNVVAIAAGACDELGLGDNARAALITRGLAEITRLAVAKGANPLTFLGLAGIGDLVLTAAGDLSRNRTLGRRVARGEKPADILASQRTVAEGFFAAKTAYELGTSLGVDMPITKQVYEILHEGKTIVDAVRELLQREHKSETQGLVPDGGGCGG
jgi:glycerol-3-phosphate dehydrogenase (NAD(P)+)